MSAHECHQSMDICKADEVARIFDLSVEERWDRVELYNPAVVVRRLDGHNLAGWIGEGVAETTAYSHLNRRYNEWLWKVASLDIECCLMVCNYIRVGQQTPSRYSIQTFS